MVLEMSIIDAIIQAIVQGLTEFLPISSSGHLALYQHIAKVPAESASFLSAILHLGTLVSVFIAFRNMILKLILEFFSIVKDIFTKKFTLKEMSEYRKMVVMLAVSLVPLLVILPLKGAYERLIAGGGIALLGLGFVLTSIVLYISDRCVKGKKTAKDMTYEDAATIGVVQAISVLPGISRSGSTIAASLFMGLSKRFAVQFSFILGIPAILAGGLLEIGEAVKATAPIEILPLVIGFVISAITGLAAIKMIAWLIESDKFTIFAYYTLSLGGVVLGLSIFEMIF